MISLRNQSYRKFDGISQQLCQRSVTSCRINVVPGGIRLSLARVYEYQGCQEAGRGKGGVEWGDVFIIQVVENDVRIFGCDLIQWQGGIHPQTLGRTPNLAESVLKSF
ncbi:hypothetical protein CDAR_420661 [Caerostris darwini]|uniref:Uncharacterized protein n=1 Tax=Caerostris darwini TaxID=1538125 RepID=A0AAV4W1J7_9ARAC|nr:hypothetical protein CDAR_420661 [Caerostris darwini]